MHTAQDWSGVRSLVNEYKEIRLGESIYRMWVSYSHPVRSGSNWADKSWKSQCMLMRDDRPTHTTKGSTPRKQEFLYWKQAPREQFLFPVHAQVPAFLCVVLRYGRGWKGVDTSRPRPLQKVYVMCSLPLPFLPSIPDIGHPQGECCGWWQYKNVYILLGWLCTQWHVDMCTLGVPAWNAYLFHALNGITFCLAVNCRGVDRANE